MDPLVRRSAVRLVVIDADERILLFQIREPLHPEQGMVWELPGGGIDPSETYVQAAIRELVEETGIVVEPRHVGPPSWHRRVTFQHAGARRIQDEVVVTIRLGDRAPVVDAALQLPDELDTYVGARWWSVTEVEKLRWATLRATRRRNWHDRPVSTTASSTNPTGATDRTRDCRRRLAHRRQTRGAGRTLAERALAYRRTER